MFEDVFTVKRLGLGYHRVTIKGTTVHVCNIFERIHREGLEIFEDCPIEYGPYPVDMQRTSDMLWYEMSQPNRYSEFAFVAHEDVVMVLRMRY